MTEVSNIVVEMVGNDIRRSRGILVPILQLVLHILSHLVIAIFSETMDLR